MLQVSHFLGGVTLAAALMMVPAQAGVISIDIDFDILVDGANGNKIGIGTGFGTLSFDPETAQINPNNEFIMQASPEFGGLTMTLTLNTTDGVSNWQSQLTEIDDVDYPEYPILSIPLDAEASLILNDLVWIDFVRYGLSLDDPRILGFEIVDRFFFNSGTGRFEGLAMAYVPEPSSTSLVGLAAIGGLAWGWRRRRTSPWMAGAANGAKY
jgi:hypothetical protein